MLGGERSDRNSERYDEQAMRYIGLKFHFCLLSLKCRRVSLINRRKYRLWQGSSAVARRYGVRDDNEWGAQYFEHASLMIN